MKAPASTTQVEATSGHAVQRCAFDTPATSRAPSPELHEEADTHYDPPTYNDNPNIPRMSEKQDAESRPEEIQRSTSRPIPEAQLPLHSNFPQCNPETFNLHMGEPSCDLISNRPAVWLVKGKEAKISALAATILLNEGVLTPKALTLYLNLLKPSNYSAHPY